MRLIGLDPGLRVTGWGIVEVDGNRLRHVADGIVRSDARRSLAERLLQLYEGLSTVIGDFQPGEAAVEKTFVNRNPQSTLGLGHARGVVLLAPACQGLAVAEYSATEVKKAVVGTGHAAKGQIGLMVRHLLPGAAPETADAADALAVAICHAHHAASHHWLQARTQAQIRNRAAG